LNPHIDIEIVASNVNDENAAELVEKVDVVVDCAPLFCERFAMNREAVRQGKVLVEAAMYDLNATLTTIIPGQTACLACLFPEDPPAWKREFPVFGACSGTVACLAAMETIKQIIGIGTGLIGQMLLLDLREMAIRKMKVHRNPNCAVCRDV